jgi:hypothetical protein
VAAISTSSATEEVGPREALLVSLETDKWIYHEQSVHRTCLLFL